MQEKNFPPIDPELLERIFGPSAGETQRMKDARAFGEAFVRTVRMQDTRNELVARIFRNWKFLCKLIAMKKFSLIFLPLLLAACVSKEGLSPQSSKTPTGNPNSSIVVIEYGDLQCPACKGAHTAIVKPLLEKYGNVIRYEFRHFPLRQIHAFAQEAAEAAECAADQGKFWEFVDDNYENQEKLSRKDLVARAKNVGVADTELFERCLKARIKRDAVQSEYEEGIERGVGATPTFFVAGTKMERNTLDSISAMIDEKLAEQKL